MITRRAVLPALFAAALLAGPAEAHAQQPDPIRDELLMQFDASMQKFIALANAFPADKYTWAPGQGVMEVGHVLMHVANYNYAYPTQNMGAALPAGIQLGAMEAVRDRAQVIRALEQSRAFVRETVGGMSPQQLGAQTRLYGRDVQGYAVLVQLVAHMNEHLGQTIAYARMNSIVPPWSR